jgi:hypothetical protein
VFAQAREESNGNVHALMLRPLHARRREATRA